MQHSKDRPVWAGTVWLGVALLCAAGTLFAADDVFRVGLAGKTWSVALKLPGFAVKMSKVDEQQRFWRASDPSRRLDIAVAISPRGGKATAEGCKEFMNKLLADQKVEGATFTNVGPFTRTVFRRDIKVHGAPVVVLQARQCAPRGDVYVDVNLTQLRLDGGPADPAKLIPILDGLALEDVPEPAAPATAVPKP